MQYYTDYDGTDISIAAPGTSGTPPPPLPSAAALPIGGSRTPPLSAATVSPSPTSDNGGLNQQRVLDDLNVSINIRPRIFQPADVEIRLNNLQGQPATGIRRVDLAMAMQGMNHGAMGIQAAPTAPGVYQVHAMLLVMEGPWLMALRVERTDGRLQTGLFDFRVPPDSETGVVPPIYRRPPGPVQVVDVAAYPDSILPHAVQVTAGQPVRLEVIFIDRPPCGPSVYLDASSLKTSVDSNGLAEFNFTPSQKGVLQFTCTPAGLALTLNP